MDFPLLDRVESDVHIKGVLIQSARPQYFCVGGDIKDIYLNYQNDQNHISQAYLEEEYALNLVGQSFKAQHRPN